MDRKRAFIVHRRVQILRFLFVVALFFCNVLELFNYHIVFNMLMTAAIIWIISDWYNNPFKDRK